jgi:hypothetical protein
MLERAFSDASVNLTSSIETADIGPSDWFYVQGLHACLTWWATSSPRDLQLTGYETDAFRIYGDFFSRCDHAYAHMDGLVKVTYVPEPFSTQPNHFDAIFLFFPFVFLKDHIIWGLPKGSFDPEELLKSVLVSLKNSGILFIVNQGEAEHEAQKALLLKHGITPIISFKHGSLIHQYKIPRYVLLALKE